MLWNSYQGLTQTNARDRTKPFVTAPMMEEEGEEEEVREALQNRAASPSMIRPTASPDIHALDAVARESHGRMRVNVLIILRKEMYVCMYEDLHNH